MTATVTCGAACGCSTKPKHAIPGTKKRPGRGARPAHVSTRRQASVQGRKHAGAHLLMYCDSFFLLARMPLTISANDFSNMAAV